MNIEDTEEGMLGVVQNTADLKAAIKRLERKRTVIEDELQEKFSEMLETLKPANILKTTLHEVQESVPLKHNLLKVALGLGAGYFSRKLIVGKSAGIVKKALGTALQFGITHFVASKGGASEDDTTPKENKKSILGRILSI